MALEAQTANNYLPIADQNRFRWQVAKKSDHLCKYNLHKINQNSKNEKNHKLRKVTKQQSHDCRSQYRQFHHHTGSCRLQQLNM